MKLTGILGLGLGMFVLGGSAYAGFSLDDNLGFARDTLSGNEHIESFDATSLIGGNVRLDPSMLDELDPNDTGSFTTKLVGPASFNGWKRFYFKASGSPRVGQTAQQMIQVAAVSSGGVVTPLTWVTSDDAAFTGMVDISGLSPGALPSMKLRFTLNEAAINPAIDEWKLTWTPYSDLRITYNAPTEACSGASISQQIAIGVNYVTARNVLVTVPLPTGTNLIPEGQDQTAFVNATRLSLQSMVPSQGGSTGANALTLASGQVVPAYTAYVVLNDVEPGSTFQVLMTMTAPVGTLHNTTYSLAATVESTNAATKTTTPRTVKVTGQPSPVITKFAVSGVYRIGNVDYANPDTYVGFRLRVEQPWTSQCASHSYNLAVWDPLTYLSSQGKIPFAVDGDGRFVVTNISDSGSYLDGPTTAYTAAPNNTPIGIPGGGILWTIPKLAIGQYRDLSFQVKLADATTFPLLAENLPKDFITNTGYVNSGFTPQTGLRQSSASVTIYPPQTPNGLYAKGKAIAGSRGLSAGNIDLPSQTVTYNDTFAWVLGASNGGFSNLEGNMFFDMIPRDRVELVSVNAPAGATVYYTGVTTHTDPNTPPGFTSATFAPPSQPDPLSTLDLSVWSTTPPGGAIANTTWVLVYVPVIGSPFRQNEAGAAPSFASADINVRVKPPTAACESFTVTNRARFETLGYRTTTNELRDANITGSDVEPIEVVPVTPWLAYSSGSASPSERIGPGPVTFSFYIPNYRIGGAAVDTSLNTEATVQLPQVPVNGVPTYLQVLSVSAGTGASWVQLPGGKIKVTLGNILPSESRTVNVTVQVPVGLLPDQSLSFSANVVGQDDVCGPFSGSGSAGVSTLFRPYLKVVKGSKFDIVRADTGALNEYPLSFTNTGTAPAKGSFVADRLPTQMRLEDVLAPPGVRLYFSQAAAPAVPASEQDWALSLAEVIASPLFTAGEDIGNVNGLVQWASPFGTNTTWVVAGTDHPQLEQLTTFIGPEVPSVIVRAFVAPGTPPTTVITNRALIGGIGAKNQPLAIAVSNQVRLAVSPDAGLDVERECAPEVVAGGEGITLSSLYTNRSTNLDVSAVVTETLAPGAVLDHARVVVFDDEGNELPLLGLDVDASELSLTQYDPDTGIFQFLINDFGPLYRATVELQVHLTTGDTGDVVFFTGHGVATGENNSEIEAQSSCEILIANPDIVTRKLVDATNPIAGDIITFTVTVENEGPHTARAVAISDTLEDGLEFYPAGGVILLTSGWSFQDLPTVTGQTLTWSHANGNALVRAGVPTTTFPGHSGPVTFTYQARVTETTPDTELDNCVEARQVDGFTEDDLEDPDPEDDDNLACVTVRTPLPDLFLRKSGPADALGGATVRCALSYTNRTRQAAVDGFIADALPDWGGDRLPPQAPGAADGKADVRIKAVEPRNGETIWYASEPLGPTAPAFPGPAWTTNLAGLPTPPNWIGIQIPFIAGNAPLRTVFVDVDLVNPRNGLLPRPGSDFVNCATITSSTADDYPANNGPACATTTIPGVDLGVTKACGAPCVRLSDATGEPELDATCIDSLSVIRPGDVVTFLLEVTNTGTENVYAIRLNDTIPAGFTVQGVDGHATIRDAAGNPAKAIDPFGQPIDLAIPWTASAGGWVLGTEGTTLNFQGIGLAPRTKARLIVTATVNRSVLSETIIPNVATVAMEQSGADPERYLLNNQAGCEIAVYRPDLRISKRAADENGGSGPVGAGSEIVWTVGFNNVGKAPANGVVISDIVPQGTALVPDSFLDLPAGYSVNYYDIDGNQLFPAGGGPDWDIYAFDIVFSDPTGAPLNDSFREDEVFEGTFYGTADQGGVVEVTQPVAQPTYTTPLVPTTTGDVLTGWRLVTLNDRASIVIGEGDTTPMRAPDLGGAATVNGDLWVTILDANDNPIAPFIDVLVEGGSGTVDISALPAATYDSIKVRVRFPTGPGPAELDTPQPFPGFGVERPLSEVWVQHENWAYGKVAGLWGEAPNQEEGPLLAAWEKVEGEWILHLLQDGTDNETDTNVSFIDRVYWGHDGAVLSQDDNYRLQIWKYDGSAWNQSNVSHFMYGYPYVGSVSSEVTDVATCERDDCEDFCGFDSCPIAMLNTWWSRPAVVKADPEYGYRYEMLSVDATEPMQWFNCYPTQVNGQGTVLGRCYGSRMDGSWIDHVVVWTDEGNGYQRTNVINISNYYWHADVLTSDGSILAYGWVNGDTPGYYLRRHYHDGEGWTFEDLLGPVPYLYFDGYPQFGPDVNGALFHVQQDGGGYVQGFVAGVGGSYDVTVVPFPFDLLDDLNHELLLGHFPIPDNSMVFAVDLFGSGQQAYLSANAKAVARYVLSTTAAWGDINGTNTTTDGGGGPVPAPLILAGDNETNGTGKLLWTGGYYGSGSWTESLALGFEGAPSGMWFAQGGNEEHGVTGNIQSKPGRSTWRGNHAAVWELENRDGNGDIYAEPLPGGLLANLTGHALGGIVGNAYFGRADHENGGSIPAIWRYEAGHHVPYKLVGCANGVNVTLVTQAGVPVGNCDSGPYSDPVYWTENGADWTPTLLPVDDANSRVESWSERLGAIQGRYNQQFVTDDQGSGFWFYQMPTLWIPDGAGFENVQLLQDHPEFRLDQIYYYWNVQPWSRSGDRIAGTLYTWSGYWYPVVWDRVAPGVWQIDYPAPTSPVASTFGLVSHNGDVVYQMQDGATLYRKVGGTWVAISLNAPEQHDDVYAVLGPDPFGVVPASTTRVIVYSSWSGGYEVLEVDAAGEVARFRLDGGGDENYVYYNASSDASARTERSGYVLLGTYYYEEEYSEPVVFHRTANGYTAVPIDIGQEFEGLNNIGVLGDGVLFAAAYDDDIGDHHLIMLVNRGNDPTDWAASDVTPEGMAMSDYEEGVAPELSESGTGVAWFYHVSDESGGGEAQSGYHLYALRPSPGGTYTSEALGINQQDYSDEPGNWISGECWLLADGQYFWGCGLGAGTGATTLDNISVSYVAGDPEVSYRTEVGATCTDTIENRAIIRTDSEEVTTANNEAFAEIGVAHADLAVRLKADKGVAAVDEQVVFTARVVNNGPNDVDEVELAFSYPDGIEPLSESPVLLGYLRKGDSFDVLFYGTVTEEANGVPMTADVHIATVADDDVPTDCRGDNDFASETIISGNYPNVWVTKVCPTSVAIGDVAICEIEYGNNGNATATDVTLTDTLPAGTALVIGPDYAASPTLAIGALEPGDSDVLLVAFEVTECSLVTHSVVNHVAISMNPDPEVNEAPDANAFDNEAADDTLVLASDARVDVEVFASRPAVEPGELVTFTAEYFANGSRDVEDAWVTITLPTNAVLVDIASASSTTGNVARWNLGTLRSGASGSVSITVRAPASPATITVSAETGGSNVCPFDPADTVIVQADDPGLHITKAASRRTVCSAFDSSVTWSIWVTNTGDAAISNIVVTDTVPGGLALIGAPTGVGASVSGGNVTWNVGTLQPGQGVELTFATQVPVSDGTLVVNQARVTWSDATGNRALLSNETPVRAQCDDVFRLAKEWDASCNAPGEPVTITLRWRNLTGRTQQTVDIGDLTTGFTAVNPGSGTIVGDHIYWTLTNVAAGASGTLTWSGTPTGASGDLLTDVALASGPGMLSQTSNVAGAVLIVCPADPDGNPCTADACDPGRGCFNRPEVPANTVCTDGNLCTDGDRCVAGACVGSSQVVCSDDNLCTTDSCDPLLGCVYRNVGDTLCDDALSCTTDSCSPTLGCINAPVDALCDDGNICTSDLCDPESEPGGTGCVFDPYTGIPEGGGTVPCGEDACGAFTGFLSCEDGVETSTCDPAYENILDTTCDDQLMVVYASVKNTAGDVIGTIRCTRTVSGGVVDCTRSADPTDDPLTLEVFDGLMCPGVEQ